MAKPWEQDWSVSAAPAGARSRPPWEQDWNVEDRLPEERGPLRAVGDVGLEVVSGGIKGIKFISDAFGADNPASRGLGAADDFVKSLQSEQAQAEDRRVGEIMRAAEDQGALEQVKAALSAAGEAPVRQSLGALATGLPVIAASFVPGLREASWGARLAALGTMGAVQGAGVVKSSIYDGVYERARQEGRNEAEARALADQAQAYSENAGLIAGGAGLGAAASATGFQPAIAQAISRAGAQTTAKAAGSTLAKEVGKGVLKEVPLEAAQGGQEQYATNVAQDRAGFDTPSMRGVVGGATLEGVLSAPGGAIGGALDHRAERNAGAAPAPLPQTPPPPAPAATTPEARLAELSLLAESGQLTPEQDVELAQLAQVDTVAAVPEESPTIPEENPKVPRAVPAMPQPAPAAPASAPSPQQGAADVGQRQDGERQQAQVVTPPAPPPAADLELQNRDRSRAASVVQMQQIARDPDYLRLGPSRTPDSGAPMVFAVGDETALAIPPDAFGREDVAVMSDGQRVPFRYAVVDATRVQPSNFADGRANPAFASTETGTLKALNNGRTAGLRAAYEQGTVGRYGAELLADAAAHGVSAAAIARTANPMLVRVYPEAANTKNMAAKSQGQGLGMGAAELARQDAPLLDSSVLGVYQGGDVTAAANRDFVRAFVGKLVGAGQDVATMMTAEGTLSPDGRKRIQAALVQAAYDDAELVADMFESTDTDIKAIGEALKQSAGQWANMRDSARIGDIDPQQDITPSMVAAVNLVRRSRRERISLYDLARQPDLMTGETPSSTTLAALRLFYGGQYLTRPVGREKLAERLQQFVQYAMATSADAGMFADTQPTALDILRAITEERPTDGQADLISEQRNAEPGEQLAGTSAAVDTDRGGEPEGGGGAGSVPDQVRPEGQRPGDGAGGRGPAAGSGGELANADSAGQAAGQGAGAAQAVETAGSAQEDGATYTDTRHEADAGYRAEAPRAGYGPTRHDIRKAIANVKPFDGPQIKALVNWIGRRPDAARIVANLKEHAGTPWARQSLEGALTRAAIEEYVAGRKPDFDSFLNAPTAVGMRELLERAGADGAWAYLAREGVVGDSRKPINSVSSSFIDCNPSKDCASFCYAAKGNFAYGASVRKSELMTWAAETDPVRLGQLIASEYTTTLEFQHQKALRLFDKGDGTDAWLSVIKTLNEWMGPDGRPMPVRVQVFSKNPGFLRQVPEMNLRMLSADKSNVEVVRANPDLPVAFVYTEASQVEFLNEIRDRVQVILPIKQGVKILDQFQIDALPTWTKPVVCPVDDGRVKIGPNRFKKTEAGSTLTTDKGLWNCTRCDKNGGVGCFHGSSTERVIAAFTSPIHTRSSHEIDRIIRDIEAFSRRRPPGERAELLGSLDRVVSAIRAGIDTGTEGTGRAGDDSRTGADDGWQPVRLTRRRDAEESEGGSVASPGAAYDDGYTQDLFGDPLPETDRETVAAGTEALRRVLDGRLDVDAALPSEGRFATEVVTRAQSTLRVGYKSIDGAAQAAHAFAHLGRYPREYFAALVVDGKNRPLAYWTGFMGSSTMTSVYSAEIAKLATSVPGSAGVWVAHNHPSGTPHPSRADEMLTKAVSDLLHGIVPLRGSLVIAGKRYTDISSLQGVGRADSGEIPETRRNVRVPMAEREFLRTGTIDGTQVGSPRDARAAVEKYLGADEGMLLLSAQNELLGVLPYSVANGPRTLRNTGEGRRLMQLIARTGAQAVILRTKDPAGGPQSQRLRNLLGLFNAMDVRPLDVIDLDGASYSERGENLTLPLFFSRRAHSAAEADSRLEFAATERAYGGRAAYERAKEVGRTKLTYGQWVQVRTPAFKAWFGDWEALWAQQRLGAMAPLDVEDAEEQSPAGAATSGPLRGFSTDARRYPIRTAVDSNARRPFRRVSLDAVSKVIDPDTGEPRVVYHGTDAEDDFEAFDRIDFGSWFAERPTTADGYSSKGRGGGPRMIPAYLSVHRPLTIPREVDLSAETELGYALRLINEANGTRFTAETFDEDASTTGDGFQFFAQPEFVEAARRAGFDGLFAYEAGEPTWNAFEPAQIKSAIGNSGAFARDDPDISASRRPDTGSRGYLAARAVQAIRRAYGAKAVDTMLALGETGQRGGLIVVDKVEQAVDAYAGVNGLAPNHRAVLALRSESEDMNGFYDPASGIAFVIAEQAGDRAASIALHEAGVHLWSDEVPEGRKAPLLERASAIVRSESDEVSRVARARLVAAGHMTSDGRVLDAEEAWAYLAEEADRAVRDGKTLATKVRNLLMDILSAIRASMYRRGWMIKAGALTPRDLAAIARENLRAAGRRAATSGASSSTGIKPPGGQMGSRLGSRDIGSAFARMVREAREELSDVLFNWNDSELNEDGDRIVSYPGRDRQFARGGEGGKVTVGKREFFEWLAGDGPEEVSSDADWMRNVARLRGILGAPGRQESADVDATADAAFRSWFGRSMVVDERGRPLVVYHGTDASIVAFKPGRGGGAIWFAAKPELANLFVAGGRRNMGARAKNGSAIYPVYLSAEKLLDLGRASPQDNMSVADVLRMAGLKADDAALARIAEANIDSGYAFVSPGAGDPVQYLVRQYSGRSRASYTLDNPALIDVLRDAGFDGIRMHEEGADTYAVFDPTQIKSATGNRGTFDGRSPDILASRAPDGGAKAGSSRFSRSTSGSAPTDGPPRAQRGRWQAIKQRVTDLTSPEALDRLIYEFQDKFVDLKRIRDHLQAIGGAVTDLNDAYLGEELYHKRLAKRTQDFVADELRPLLSNLKAANIPLPQFERFLHARHALEANRVLAERNPNQEMIDARQTQLAGDVHGLELQLQRAQANGAATRAIEQALKEAREEAAVWSGVQAYRGTEEERLALSGMSDAEAAALMDSLPAGQREHLDALAARVDAINARTLELLERYGLMDRASLDAWRRTYRFYVPLHRDEAHPDTVAHPIGQGFSVKGEAAKSRTGSTRKVTNILGHIAMQREAALTRGEKNRVVKQLYLLAAQNPDENLWAVDEPPMVRSLDRATGTVRTHIDPAYKHRPNVLMLRAAGKDVAITFNERNPQAMRLAEAMKNLDVGDLHVVLSLTATATRWFASVNTQYNPIFGVINFLRDVQTGVLNLSTTPLAGAQRQVLARVPAAMRAIYRATRDKTPTDRQWAALWAELQEVGGTTGYRDLFADAADRTKALERELAALNRGAGKRAAMAIVDWLSDYNETMESAVRLAAYKVALDRGLTKERAASLAKNLTVNFNRKGRQARELGALYAFFNASVQGTARMMQTLRGPLGKRVMAGGVSLGALSALLGMSVMGGGDDDEWEKIPEFVKERSVIIPLGRREYVSLPMPLGFHVLPNIGRLAVEFMLGGPEKTAGKQIGNLLMVVADAFNPMGGAQNLGQMISPTVIDPAVALVQNRDWTGRPIYREDLSSLDPTPGPARTKDSTSTFSKVFADMFNRMSGGTEFRPGAISWSPDAIDYVIGQLTGGLGRELIKLNQAVTAPFTGEELPTHKIPLLGRIYGTTRGASGEGERFYENVREINEVENEVLGNARRGRDVQAILDSEPLAVLIGAGNAAETQVRRLRTLRRDVVREGLPGYPAEVRRINEQIGEVMADLNRQVRRARRSAVVFEAGGG